MSSFMARHIAATLDMLGDNLRALHQLNDGCRFRHDTRL